VAKSSEELRVQIEYNVSGKQVNYALAAILGISGYAFYPSSSSGQEVSRHSFIKLQSEVREIQLEMKVFSTRLPKIEKDEKSSTL